MIKFADNKLLSQKQLKAVLNYNPESGLFSNEKDARDAYLAAKSKHHPLCTQEAT